MPARKREKAPPSTNLINKPELTLRETQVALGIADGLTYEEVGQGLELSVETVRAYVKGLRDKTGRRRKTQLAIWASSHRQWLEKEQRSHQKEDK